MSFPRAEVKRILQTAGLETVTADVVDELCALNKSSIDGIAAERDAKATELEQVQAAHKALSDELEGVKAELATAGEANNGEALEALQAEFDAYKSEVAGKERTAKLDNEKAKALKAAGFPDSVIGLLLKDDALGSVDFDESGALTGLEDAVKATTEKHASLIVETKHAGGYIPPAGAGGAEVDPSKMTMKEYAEWRRK